MDLTNIPLFQEMTSIDAFGYSVDLHNDYHCFALTFDKDDRSLNLAFTPNHRVPNNPRLCLIFRSAVITSLNMKLEGDLDARTIDSLYRGRFEVNSETLAEYSPDGKSYFYIEFANGTKLELFCANVFIAEV